MQTNYSRLEQFIILLYVMFLFGELGAVASNYLQLGESCTNGVVAVVVEILMIQVCLVIISCSCGG
jgi:hypothetical protein